MNSTNDLTFDRHEAEVSPTLISRALAGAKRTSYWLDHEHRPAPHPALHGSLTTDLLIIGGGYTGLWTALQAKEQNP
ncbi:MAG: FAD-dependent oxidoreductase, partial [Glutamicibacter sp.]